MKFSPRQSQIFKLLAQRSTELSNRYVGMIIAKSDSRNPDSLAQAANSARHLLKELHKISDSHANYKSQGTAFQEIKDFVENCCEETTIEKVFQSTTKLKEYFQDAQTEFKERFDKLLQNEDKGDVKYPECYEFAVQILRKHIQFFDKMAHYEFPPDHMSKFENAVIEVEEILIGLLESHFHLMSELDKVLNNSELPHAPNITLPALLLKGERLTHFFNNLEHVGWLDYLRAVGYFSRPLSTIEKDGGVSSPVWPQSKYLQACTKTEPQKVLDIIRESENTENWTVNASFIDIVLGIPPAISAKIVGDKTMHWVKNSQIPTLPDKLASLIVHLAEAAQKEANTLAVQLFAVRLYEPANSSQRYHSDRCVGYYEEWSYERALRKAIPSLFKFNPNLTIKTLKQILVQAIKIEGFDKTREASAIRMMRPFIGANEEKSFGNAFINSLIDSLRDISILNAENIPTDAFSPIKTISIDFEIIKRIELHVLSRFPEKFIDRKCELIIDTAIIHSEVLEQEVQELIESSFDNLPKTVQDQYVELILND